MLSIRVLRIFKKPFKLEQPEKALSPMEMTVSGRLIEPVKQEHPEFVTRDIHTSKISNRINNRIIIRGFIKNTNLNIGIADIHC